MTTTEADGVRTVELSCPYVSLTGLMPDSVTVTASAPLDLTGPECVTPDMIHLTITSAINAWEDAGFALYNLVILEDAAVVRYQTTPGGVVWPCDGAVAVAP